MEFRIADTFTDSLARLTGDEQKAVKTTAFDLQMNPANPGFSFHKLEKAKDKNFWSVRVSGDIRLIVHKTSASLLLCYVGHHDKAYEWAERRKLETHPKTGAAQLVEIRERVEEIIIPRYVESKLPKPLFEHIPDSELLSYGVPSEWLKDVQQANEDSILDVADHLPAEAAEALLSLATGEAPHRATPSASSVRLSDQRTAPTIDLRSALKTEPFSHPDAQRRFRLIHSQEELERALDFPWEKWIVFLHPEQRKLVERAYNGPARVTGSAGTGKTIVALHRAAFLARSNPDARVLLTTFSETLANALRTKLKRLISNEPRLGERLEVHAMKNIGQRLYEANFGRPHIVSNLDLRRLIDQASSEVERHKFSAQFLFAEWSHVVDAWQLTTWEAYRDVARLGRKTRLAENQRRLLWSIFEKVGGELKARNLVTIAGLFARLTSHLAQSKHPPFEFAVVDEAQDISVPQLKFLAALGSSRPNSLFFAGDSGQRIFQQAFSWKSLGIDVRGRSTTLHVNYRTSHQIRTKADRLLGPEVSDVDDNTEERRGTVSVFNGPKPEIMVLKSPEDEIEAVCQWLKQRISDEIKPHEIAVFVRSVAQLDRARKAVEQAGVVYKVLDNYVETTTGYTSIATMHLAKGLEFRAIAVMACDDEVIPLQERIQTAADDSDLEDVYNTERHLLYVACTRARDHLLVTSGGQPSEFLDDLAPSSGRELSKAAP
jgi:superfamily I DNA/RNA helicase/mRNA-degrading endonuclease RelE of RelBE toxin-antitoxin system